MILIAGHRNILMAHLSYMCLDCLFLAVVWPVCASAVAYIQFSYALRFLLFYTLLHCCVVSECLCVCLYVPLLRLDSQHITHMSLHLKCCNQQPQRRTKTENLLSKLRKQLMPIGHSNSPQQWPVCLLFLFFFCGSLLFLYQRSALLYSC